VSDNRAFHCALGASLALHALALFTMPQLADTARRAASIPPQIIARLMEPAPPAPEPVPPVDEPRIKPAPPKPKAAKPKAERPLAVEKPAPVAPSREPEAVVEQAPAVPAPPPVAAVEPRAPAPAAAQAAPQPAPESLSRDQYRVQLIDEARRHKRYPPLARENNWQGDVRVGVTIGANGRPTVTLKGSSGFDVLDRQALEMFTQAARAVPLPPALRGKEFTLEVRAIYGLED
jgi:periplasmic protein TonB